MEGRVVQASLEESSTHLQGPAGLPHSERVIPDRRIDETSTDDYDVLQDVGQPTTGSGSLDTIDDSLSGCDSDTDAGTD